MGSSCMAGDLCNTFISILDGCPPISGSNQGINIFSCKPCILQGLLQGTFCTNGSPCAGRQDDPGYDLSVFIQDHHICTGGSAVNACKITFSHFPFLSFPFILHQAFCKCLQSGKKLSAALYSIIRLDLQQRHCCMLL